MGWLVGMSGCAQVAARMILIATFFKADRMRDAVRQLKRVRRVGRTLLLIQRLAQCASAVLIVLMLCGLTDYALRLPGWLRLLVGLWICLGVGAWLVSRVSKAVGFRPALSVLALRVERLYPHLAGVLASGVDLECQWVGPTDALNTAALRHASIEAAQRKVADLPLRRLVAFGRTARLVLIALGVFTVFSAVVWAAPDASRLAARRWFTPLSDVQWPRRTRLRSMLTEYVWPDDTPIRFKARVERGYFSQMRTWVVYRFVDDADGQSGSWQSLLMNEQAMPGTDELPSAQDSRRSEENAAMGVFERVVDLDEESHRWSTDRLSKIEFYFLAGDGQTQLQTLELVARPAVVSVQVAIEPPVYAQGLVAHQKITLSQGTDQVATATAMVGSRIQLRVAFNKPLQEPENGWDSFMPGLGSSIGGRVSFDPPLEGGRSAGGILKSFVLKQTLQTPIRLTDGHGLSSLSEQVYRIEAITDQSPTVSMTQPASDESVSANAVIEVWAIAQDDVGVDRLSLEAEFPLSDQADRAQALSQSEALPPMPVTLAQVAGRRPSLEAEHVLHLQPLGLKPGDEVLLTAVGRDVFELDGDRHEPVRSSPRRLRILDTASLIGQIRNELAGVRQQAIRIKDQQQRLLDSPADPADSDQHQISQSLDAQNSRISSLQQRAQRNRLSPQDAGHLLQLMDRSGEIAQRARQSSESAQQSLDEARRQPQDSQRHHGAARDEQQNAHQALAELIELLDQGRDTLALQLQLQQIKAMQEALEKETRHLMPQTLGWSVDELNKLERQQLKDLTDRQEALAKQSQVLLDQMQATADALSRQSDSADDQAASQALSEAASIARRQGLTPALKQAAQKTEQNRLSAAGNDQQEALAVMENMLAELTQMEQRRQAILRRRLIELAQAIRGLIDQQEAQKQRLDQAVELSGFDATQASLRRNTMATAQRARSAPKTKDAASLLDDATDHQAEAISALRQTQRDPAVQAQQQALERLNQALALVEQLQQEAQAQQTGKQREKLRQAYLKLAQEQQVIRQETTPLSDRELLPRRERAALSRLGHREADLQIAVRELRAQIDKTLVFTYLHGKIDQVAASVVTQLRGLHADQDVLDQQDMIASLLDQMAQALAKTPDDEPFAGSQSSGEGGGGGGGGAPTALVPPIAELKLLRGMQDSVYRATRAYNQKLGEGHPTTPRPRVVEELHEQQRRLTELGGHLIRLLRQSQQPSPSP